MSGRDAFAMGHRARQVWRLSDRDQRDETGLRTARKQPEKVPGFYGQQKYKLFQR